MSLTQLDLKSQLYYDPIVGVFIWKKSLGKKNGGFGSIAKPRKFDGYVRIKINGIEYSAHRLVWLYLYGEFPTVEIDHRNLIRSDNALTNLREASKSQQEGNKPARVTNKLGVKGVRRLRVKAERYEARFHQTTIGTYPTIELARQAYIERASEFYGEFSRG